MDVNRAASGKEKASVICPEQGQKESAEQSWLSYFIPCC